MPEIQLSVQPQPRRCASSCFPSHWTLTNTGKFSCPAVNNSLSLLCSDRSFHLALKDIMCEPLGHKRQISLIWSSEGAQALNPACCTSGPGHVSPSVTYALLATATEKPKHLLCTVLHCKLNFIIRYTHLSPTAAESEPFRRASRVKKSTTYKPALPVTSIFPLCFAQIPILQVHRVLQLVLGWLLNWETFSVLVQLHSCSFFQGESRTSIAVRALATRLALSCRAWKFAI